MRCKAIFCALLIFSLTGCRSESSPQSSTSIATASLPVLDIPVDMNDPSASLEMLSAANVQRITPIARAGEGTFGDHLVVSPLGDVLAAATAGGVLLVDAATGQRRSFLPASSSVESLAFSPDGQQLATIHREPGQEVFTTGELAGQPVNHPVFTLYDLQTGKVRYSLNLAGRDCGQYAAWDLAFAPDGKTLIFRDFYSQIGHSRTDHLCLLSISDGALLRSIPIELPWQSVSPVLFTPDGKQLVLPVVESSTEGSPLPTTRVNFYDGTTGTLLREIDGQGLVHDLALSPDGSILALADQRGARLLSVQDGTLLGHIGEHNREVFAVAFSPDGAALALGSLDGTVSTWSVKDDQLMWQTETSTPYLPWNIDDVVAEIWDLEFSPNGSTLFALAPSHLMDAAGQIQALDITDGQKLYQVNGYTPYSVPGLSPDKKRAAFGGYVDGQVQVWSLTENRPILHLIGHTGLVTRAVFSPDGKILASASLDGTIRIWSSADGSSIRTLTGHTGPVRAIQFSPDGSQIASLGDDATLRLWNVGDGQLHRVYNTQTTNWLANAITYAPDGQKVMLAYGCPYVNACQANGAGDLRQIDLNTGQIETRIPYSVYTISLATDQAHFAIEGAQTIQSGELAGGQLSIQRTYTSPLGNGALIGAGISPDGQLFFSGNAFGLHVWNASSGEMLALCKGTSLPYGNILVTPDQKMLFIAGPDGLASLWGVPSG